MDAVVPEVGGTILEYVDGGTEVDTSKSLRSEADDSSDGEVLGEVLHDGRMDYLGRGNERRVRIGGTGWRQGDAPPSYSRTSVSLPAPALGTKHGRHCSLPG